jgi:hypothetical protein
MKQAAPKYSRISAALLSVRLAATKQTPEQAAKKTLITEITLGGTERRINWRAM